MSTCSRDRGGTYKTCPCGKTTQTTNPSPCLSCAVRAANKEFQDRLSTLVQQCLAHHQAFYAARDALRLSESRPDVEAGLVECLVALTATMRKVRQIDDLFFPVLDNEAVIGALLHALPETRELTLEECEGYPMYWFNVAVAAQGAPSAAMLFMEEIGVKREAKQLLWELDDW